MIPWETLDEANAPDGGKLRLYRRGGEYSIRVDGVELMSSRAHGSEEEMARLARGARVLIGGLGMGYTLRAALDVAPHRATIVVVEIVQAVVEWNRKWLGALAGNPLDDRRVQVLVADVGVTLRSTKKPYDAILLDVDNGPRALTRDGNDVLYRDEGLAMVKRALSPRGALAVWSASPDVSFEKRLRRARFEVETHEVPARGVGGGPKHTIFVARL